MDDADPRPGGRFAGVAPCALAATRLSLVNFRSYAEGEISLSPLPVVLAGANGTGKTNLLEALSLLSPGRGLRGAKLSTLQRKAPKDMASGKDAFAGPTPDLIRGHPELWAVSATIARPDGLWEIGTGLLPSALPAKARRALHLNGAPADSADLAELLPMLWLTPAMDRLFLEGAGERRRFLDRLVFAVDASHAKRATRYERAMHERLRLLREGSRDPVWLDGLEASMAEAGSALSAARLSFIDGLNAELAQRGVEGAFPCAHLALSDRLGDGATDETHLQNAFAASRDKDAEAGRTSVGPHLANLEVRHTVKRTDARDCSTGEQKALLISIVLANAWIKKRRHGGVAPLLLLDEIAAHLDLSRRTALFEEILALGSQAWLTGTDKSLFAPLATRAHFFTIEAGCFVAMESA